MPSLSIPEQHRSGLAKIRTLPDESASGLLAALRGTPTSPKLASFVSDLAPAVGGIAPADLERIVATLYSLYQVNAFRDAPLEKFVRDVLQAMELSGYEDLKVPLEERDSFLERMRGLLSVGSLAILAKAQSLERDREHLFHDARVLSDLRPVFGPEPNDPPVGAIVVHTLKIVFHDAGSHSEIYLALDSADIAKLRAILERAETKATSLKSLLEDKQISNLAFS